MKINNIKEAEKFIATADSCKGDVFLTSIYGDKFNLKSKLSQYVGIASLIGDHAGDLELYCSNKEDEAKFLRLFAETPDLLG